MNSLGQQLTALRDKIALAMCPLGFVMALFISSIGWMVGVNTLPAALVLFLLVEAGGLALALTAWRRPLAKIAAILAGASAALGLAGIASMMIVTIASNANRSSEVVPANFNHYTEMARQQGAVPAVPQNVRPTVPATGYRNVSINSIRLTDAQVAAIELSYGTRVPDGRFWVDAFGNFGYEGGPALGNLGAAGTQYNGGAGNGGGAVRKGVHSSYDMTGVAVYDLR